MQFYHIRKQFPTFFLHFELQVADKFSRERDTLKKRDFELISKFYNSSPTYRIFMKLAQFVHLIDVYHHTNICDQRIFGTSRKRTLNMAIFRKSHIFI